MNLTGIPVSRWIDGVLEDPDNMDNPNNVRAMVLWGHAPNSQTRQKEMKTAMEKLDMLVVVDPYPTVSAVLHDRTDGVYLLPACTQFETRGSVTASNRSFQWRDKVVDPLFEAYRMRSSWPSSSNKFGWADRFFRNIEMEDAETPNVEASHASSTAACGPLATQVKALSASRRTWRTSTRLIAQRFKRWVVLRMAITTVCHGHAGALLRWVTLVHLTFMTCPNRVSEGGLTFRARFGVERDGDNLLAEGVYGKDSDIQDGYPEFTMQMLMDLGWDNELTDDERAAIDRGCRAENQLENRPFRRYSAGRHCA